MEWGPEHERVLAEWGDKANCYNWLHTKCHEKFHELHNIGLQLLRAFVEVICQ